MLAVNAKVMLFLPCLQRFAVCGSLGIRSCVRR